MSVCSVGGAGDTSAHRVGPEQVLPIEVPTFLWERYLAA